MKTETRKLSETSWLAQIISDKMEVEFAKNSASEKWLCLQTLKAIVNEADSGADGIYRQNRDGRLQIVVSSIPSLAMKYGLDFTAEGMLRKLTGLAERYRAEGGGYIVRVLSTHDLNSATIEDVSALMDAISADN